MKPVATALTEDDFSPIVQCAEGAKLAVGTELFLCTHEDVANARRYEAFVGAMLADINHQDHGGPEPTAAQRKIGETMADLQEEPLTLAAVSAAIDKALAA